MKTLRLKKLLAIIGMVLYVPSAFSHTSGVHSGGMLQQLIHMLQSADHLFIVLALVVVVSVLIRQAINKTNHQD